MTRKARLAFGLFVMASLSSFVRCDGLAFANQPPILATDGQIVSAAMRARTISPAADSESAPPDKETKGMTVTLIAALVAAVLAYLRYQWQLRGERKTRMNVLFGELANLYEHCTYAKNELLLDFTDLTELRWRLKRTTYGRMHLMKDISRYGFLTADEIRLLLQLSLFVRNNDLLLFLLLKDTTTIKADHLAEATRRMTNTIAYTQILMDGLARRRRRFKPIMKDITNRLARIGKPPVGDVETEK